jgi:predicted esterase
MGSGRLDRGAMEWTDFINDDHGANGQQVAEQTSDLAPTIGSYVYPHHDARGNGADLFRVGVGIRNKVTYWRVDWNTLARPKVPIAEWALDTDHSRKTGTSTWPGGAGVTSTGEDRFVLVSSRGAWLINARGHRRNVRSLGGHLTVNRASRSFVVSLPTHVLHPHGGWRVRLAAGVANHNGDGFQRVTSADGALSGQPAVYNLGFRRRKQEPAQITPPSGPNGVILPTTHDDYTEAEDEGTMTYDHGTLGNFWNEGAQAFALAGDDVSKFSTTIHWSRLRRHRTTKAPMPKGYSVRWYVAHRNNLGQGTTNNADDVHPRFLGRVQPYSVYVPSSYRRGHPAPLTWILHSLGVNHNQYAALSPKLIQQLCEARHSVCATTNDRGPGGWYHDDGEVDFWSVWHALASSYTLDSRHTVLSGYSMGGYAAYKLGLEYPDVFAKSVALAGPPICGLRLAGSVQSPDGPGHCTTDGDTGPLVGNATWLPFQMGDGTNDEEVPFSGVLQQIAAFRSAGDRFKFQAFAGADHLVWAVQDGFHSIAVQVRHPHVKQHPGHFSYTFYPNLVDKRRGIGPTRDYWVTHLRARKHSPGTLASVTASSGRRPTRAVTLHDSEKPVVDSKDAEQSTETTQRWSLGARPSRTSVVRLRLADVRSLRVNLAAAGFAGRHGVVRVTTDGRTRVRLSNGRTVHLKAGHHRIHF